MPIRFCRFRTQTAKFHFSLSSVNPQSSPRPSNGSPAPVQVPPPPASQGSSPRYLFVWLEQAGAAVKLPDDTLSWDLGSEDRLITGIERDLPVSVTPLGAGEIDVAFHFQASIWNSGNFDMDIGQAGSWNPEARPEFATAMLPFMAAFLLFGVSVGTFLFVDRRQRLLRERTTQRLENITPEEGDKGDKNHFAWQSARIKLEAYFDRNLIQVNLVFWAAILVMSVGFCFVMAGLILSFRNPKDVTTSTMAAGCGVITQFIGATFIVIYRSIMRQAGDFMGVLERINIVGMAVNELDQIPEASRELKDKVRAQFVTLLLSGDKSTGYSQGAPSAEMRDRSGASALS